MKRFFVYAIQGLILIGPAFYFGLVDKTTAMGLALAASFLAVAFMNFDQIRSLSAGTIKLEKYEKVIEEAGVTIENLRKVTAPLSAYVLTTIGTNNNFDYKMTISFIDRLSQANEDINDDIVQKLLEGKITIIYNKFKKAFIDAGDSIAYHEMIQPVIRRQFGKVMPTPQEIEIFLSTDIYSEPDSTQPEIIKRSVETFKMKAKPILNDYKSFYLKNVEECKRDY
ncbi:hypothetical protein HB847_09540 [Listeria booriae]|uniref:Uncharacterized protein n=1 Tax=Listeria booriae TaxID=1552123 RepID=A0A841Y7X6_9LIST|nr:hypothetical protein [Listeria booriae]MBC1372614.1 hypothetical protein [Listeria booriae]